MTIVRNGDVIDRPPLERKLNLNPNLNRKSCLSCLESFPDPVCQPTLSTGHYCICCIYNKLLYMTRVTRLNNSYTSCIDCCIVHSNSAHADPDLVGGGCSCILLLHSTPTCADTDPKLCTLRWWCYYVYCITLP